MTTPSPDQSLPARSTSGAGDVFRAFLKLGFTSFGGPIAHLGYFRDELVIRRRWVDEATYGDLVALCQFLPGPASSQVGFALGLIRGGPLGALAAWCAFTLPSALLLVAFASSAAVLEGPVGAGLLHGLKLVAVAVVAQAVWGMARTLTPDRPRAGIAFIAVLIAVFLPGPFGQVASIALGALAGLWLCRGTALSANAHLPVPVTRTVGLAALLLFFALLFALPLLAASGAALFEAFYRSGALVFGGGHVVLPLLQASVVEPGWIDPATFLAGYGLAQAVPGPLFTFAAYLGAAMPTAPNGLLGGMIALAAIFLPGLLLVTAALPFWGSLRARPTVQAAMRGANAAVVGILGAALYDPVWTSAIHLPRDFALALAGFVLLTAFKCPPWIIVLGSAIVGMVLGMLGAR
ncbi:chromate efflux transporter [Aureimonas psammosilenae]